MDINEKQDPPNKGRKRTNFADGKTTKYARPSTSNIDIAHIFPIDQLGYNGHSYQLQIANQNYQAYEVPGDGHCFFHCVSLALMHDIKWHIEYRQLICQHIYDNWDIFSGIVTLCHDNCHTKEEYAHIMIHNAGYATTAEITAAAEILQKNFTIMLKGTTIDAKRNVFLNTWHSQNFPTHSIHGRHTISLMLSNTHYNLLIKECECPETTPESTAELSSANTNTSTSMPQRQAKTSGEFQTQRKVNNNSSVNDRNSDNSDSHKTTERIFNNEERPKSKVEYNCNPHISYLTCENNNRRQARKLGVIYEEAPSCNNETRKEEQSRKKRNSRNILKQKTLFNIDNTDSLPDPPEQSSAPRFNQAMDSIRAFELQQMSYTFKTCSICNECRLDMEMTNATTCTRCKKDNNNVKMFSAENMMDPGQVPTELDNLTIVEQQLICRISPSINVHMLKHGGIAANGHCVTFPQDINEPSQIFPKLPQEINIIKVRKQGRNDTSKDFNVRRYKVQSALVWLQNNNPAYTDIIISQERLDMLPLDGDLPNIPTVTTGNTNIQMPDEGPAPAQTDPGEVDGETSSGVLLPDPKINLQKQVENIVEEVVGPGHGEVTSNRNGVLTIPWPTRDDTPISEFTTKYFFTLAFPHLFPYGSGDFLINRERSVTSMADWAEHLLWFKDGRFARHQYFKFIVHNIILRKKALENSTYVIRQQLGDQHLTVADLKDKLQKGDQSIAKKILYFGASLRGTSQYWTQRSRELRGLIQYQINQGHGLPSLFTTGSCAEYHFKPLRRLLQQYTSLTTGQEIDLKDRNALFSSLQQNSHIVGKYFDLRTLSYFEKVMKPVFGVNTYWYRQEFAKSRGMIHWHGLCWRKDREPHVMLHESVEAGLSGDQCAEKISNWAKMEFGMTAVHPAGKGEDGAPRKDLWPPPEGTAPPPPDEKNPLVKLLMDVSETQQSLLEDHLLLTNRINLHRCSSYCLRGKGKSTCRMEFGTKENPGKTIRANPAIVKDKNKSLRLEMERDHPMLVQHSKFHTQGWRANGDVSIILSKSGPDNPSVDEIIGTEIYVTGYACKGNESTGATADLFDEMINKADDDTTTASTLCTKLLMGTVKRDVSSTEASYEISRLPLYRCSHQFQSVSMSGSRVLEKNGFTLTKKTPLDRYLCREENDKSSWYNFICRSGKVPVIAGTNIRPSWPLNEEYCRTVLLLHWPNWRTIKDIKSDDISWRERLEEFLTSNVCPNFIRAEIERVKTKETENATETDEPQDDEPEQPEWMDLIRPAVEFEGISEFNFDDGGPDYDWSSTTHAYPVDLGVKWLDELDKTDVTDTNLKIPDVKLSSMNEKQRLAFNLILTTLLQYKRDPTTFKDPLRLIIAGTAGSGKTYLIQCLIKAIRSLFQTNKSVQVVCPTGSSANMISGRTIHSFFKVPTGARSKKEMSTPDGSLGAAVQANCDGLLALLVDERSLVGCTTLGWMEYLCTYGANKASSTTQSWGGIPVVVFLGDDVQLPPVCDSPVFNCKSTSPAAMHGALTWKLFNKAIVLDTIIRQNSTQTRLKDTLNSLREYKMTAEQAKWLQNFQWDNLKATFDASLLERMENFGLFVFPTHAEEWLHNKTKLLQMNKQHPIAKIIAESRGVHKDLPGEKAAGLSQRLYLCKGAKVMLTTNLNVDHGLFNGSMGQVVDIIYKPGRNPTTGLPDVIMVNFCKYTGPPFLLDHPNIVPIVPVERLMDCLCHFCRRKQVPLRLGWGTTIHRCQGMTIGSNEANRYIVINPGTTKFESRNPGALFVALSRAKTAGDKQTDPDFAWNPKILVNPDRLNFVVNTSTTRARGKEIIRITKLAQQTMTDHNSLDNEEVFNTILEEILGNNISEE